MSKILQNDPSGQNDKLTATTIKTGFDHLGAMCQALKTMMSQKVVLCTVRPDGSITRLLNPPLESVMDDDLSTVGSEVVTKYIGYLRTELAEAGIEISDEVMEELLPNEQL